VAESASPNSLHLKEDLDDCDAVMFAPPQQHPPSNRARRNRINLGNAKGPGLRPGPFLWSG